MKKILIYNWSHLDNSNICGGVSVYTRNLISELLKNRNYEVLYLNSGYTYTINNKLAIKPSENVFGDQVKSYEIINSPVIAPAQQSIKNTEQFLNDTTLYELIKNWLQSIHGVDIIHFQNLEGLSLNVLKLKDLFPRTKFLYSLHNYFPLCTSVTLWNKVSCCNGSNFNNCEDCFFRRRYSFSKLVRISKDSRIIEGCTYYLSKVFPDKGNHCNYENFAKKNVILINKYMDQLLAVSDRVKSIFVNKGYNQNKVRTSYIGTRVAENALGKSNNPSGIDSPILKICYMGYMSKLKGFHFFIDVLNNIPREFAQKINVTICAKHSKRFQKKELLNIKHLKTHLHSVDLINGYTPLNQQSILTGQDLGIVPVLWEDNLPQVLIEQISYGVPVLCSDLGGGKEIVNNPDFIFKAGDTDDCVQKIVGIIKNRTLLNSFWKSVKKLTTMQDHIKDLIDIYEQP